TNEPAAILAAPPPSTTAAQAGFQAGDQITSVNDEPVQSWSEARWQMLDALTSGGEPRVQVNTATGRSHERRLDLQPAAIEPEGSDLMADAGLMLAAPRPLINQITPGGAGEQAGLRDGDVVIALGSLKEPSANAVVTEIQNHAGQP